MFEELTKQIEERLNKGFSEAEPMKSTATGAQSITGNGNTQVGNNQKLVQRIEGNNNVQVAGDA